MDNKTKMTTQRYCPDYNKKAKTHSESIGFTYPIGNWELNLCRECEALLRKVILCQVDIENWLKPLKKSFKKLKGVNN